MYKLIPALLLLALTACSKYKPGDYPVTQYQLFQNSHLTRFGAYKLYTAAGEVAQPGLAQQYASEFGQYFYDESSTFSDPAFRTFSVVSEDSMFNTSVAPVYGLKRTAIDVYDKFCGRGLLPVNDTNDLHLHIAKYRSFKTETTPSGVTYFTTEDPHYILKKEGDTLFFPIVRYIAVSRRAGIVIFAADRFNDVFDPSGVNKLGPQDTLLVQTFDLAMKKVN